MKTHMAILPRLNTKQCQAENKEICSKRNRQGTIFSVLDDIQQQSDRLVNQCKLQYIINQ